MKRSTATLQQRWEELKKAVATRGKALEDNRDFLEFLQKVEEVEAWIRHKVGGGMEGMEGRDGGMEIHSYPHETHCQSLKPMNLDQHMSVVLRVSSLTHLWFRR